MPVPLLRFEWRARLLRGSEDTLPGVSRPTGQVASSSTTWRNKPCAMATVDIHSSAAVRAAKARLKTLAKQSQEPSVRSTRLRCTLALA